MPSPSPFPSEYRDAIARAFARACAPALERPPPVGKPRVAGRGDLATPAALMLAKVTGENPREAAKRLLQNASLPDFVDGAEVAGAGFINIRLKPEAKTAVVGEILQKGARYGSRPQEGETVLLEFVSANPTGPLHIGHGRAAAYGDSLAKILAFSGARVWREYYLNDAGRQIDILAASAWLRPQLPPGETLPEGAYRGDYLAEYFSAAAAELPQDGCRLSPEEVAALLAQSREAAKAANTEDAAADALVNAAKTAFGEEAFAKWSAKVAAVMRDSISADLRTMGVEDFHRWFSERDDLRSGGKIPQALEELAQKAPGALYEKDGALWFKSAESGDDKDRVLRRANGEHTYFAADAAYHRDKLARAAPGGKPFARLINVLGADHHGYVPRIAAVVRAFGGAEVALEIPLIQFVALYEDGARVKMSTRAGKFASLAEMIAAIGADAARYFFVSRRNDQHLDVDMRLARAKNKKNPVYYIQYAHARLCAVLKRAQENGGGNSGDDVNSVNGGDGGDGGDSTARNMQLAQEPAAVVLCERLMAFPDLIARAAQNRAPHLLAAYLLEELAPAANSYYEKTPRIIREKNPDRKRARLSLLAAARAVLASGLTLLGMSAPQRMYSDDADDDGNNGGGQ